MVLGHNSISIHSQKVGIKKQCLYVVTDLKDVRWFKYILEEFSRINLSKFSIQVRDIHQSQKKGENTFYYVKDFIPGVCIQNRSDVNPNGKVQWVSDLVFTVEDTLSDEMGWACQHDIFWNAFVFLSRLEEYQSEAGGRKIQSYRFKHSREDKTTFDIPVVNHFFDELEGIIKANFPELRFGVKQNPIIEYSHDVDYIQKSLQLRLKQTAFNVFSTLRSVPSPRRFTEQAKRTVKFFFSNPSYWHFDYWEELEKRAHIRSVFYVYAKTGKNNLWSWLIDPSYDLAKNIGLQNKLKCLIQEGFQVGLHGSYYSATDEKMLSKEKSVLEESIGEEVQKTRQHWLRYEEKTTPYIHNKLFKYDSTLGWNDCMGFRSGVACRYLPYDHNKQKPFDYMITPQVIMDSHIYDYGADRVEFLEEKALGILKCLYQFKSAYISTSWHQRVVSRDYGWHVLYEKILTREKRKFRQHDDIVN
jgi:Family of unknown function (DUF7033)